jgi:hypothetical protein
VKKKMMKSYRAKDMRTNRTGPNLTARGEEAMQDGYIEMANVSSAMSAMSSA